MSKINGKDLLIGAVVGSVLGAISALLFAPKPGRELRADISEQYHAVSEKTKELGAKVGEKSVEIAHIVGAQTSEWVGKAKEVASTVGDGVKSLKSSVKETAADVEEQLEEVGSGKQ